VAVDTDDNWYVDPREGRMQPRRTDSKDLADDRAADHPDGAACTVSGPASGVYLYLWNRVDAARARVTVTGDAHLLLSWQSSVRVRWD
jgi:hypothetical protein